jgi:hypothetical protein
MFVWDVWGVWVWCVIANVIGVLLQFSFWDLTSKEHQLKREIASVRGMFSIFMFFFNQIVFSLIMFTFFPISSSFFPVIV